MDELFIEFSSEDRRAGGSERSQGDGRFRQKGEARRGDASSFAFLRRLDPLGHRRLERAAFDSEWPLFWRRLLAGERDFEASSSSVGGDDDYKKAYTLQFVDKDVALDLRRK
jgi:hypothetical protein